MTDDLYQALDLPKDADEAAIKKARNRKARQHHPDNGAEPSVEKFDRAQRAYLVLSDPAKRQQYDETGKTDFKSDPEAEEAAEAMNLLASCFGAVLSNGCDPRTVDVVAQMREMLRQAIRTIGVKVSDCHKASERLQTFKKRLKRKSEAEGDVLTELVDGQIRAVNQQIGQYERAKRTHERALKLADGYEYKTDQSPPYSATNLDRLIGPGHRAFNIFSDV